jgi:hypothetical protein
VKLERVTTAGDSVVAEVVRGLLESEGIPVMLRAYGPAGWLFPGTPGGLGAMDVLVPEERVDEARELLRIAEANGAAKPHDAAAGTSRPPHGHKRQP